LRLGFSARMDHDSSDLLPIRSSPRGWDAVCGS
jgi:hypothetical protein